MVGHNTKFIALQLTNWYRVRNYFGTKADSSTEELGQMKVVKLLYFALSRWIAQTGGKLFTSNIIAMLYEPVGQVVEKGHQKFAGKRGIVSRKLKREAFNDYNLIQSDEKIADLLTAVDDDFRDYAVSELVKITHLKRSS